MGIKSTIYYEVYCDQCGRIFDDGKPPMRSNETHLYTSRNRAFRGIQVFGWIVKKNGLIICKSCNEKNP